MGIVKWFFEKLGLDNRNEMPLPRNDSIIMIAVCPMVVAKYIGIFGEL